MQARLMMTSIAIDIIPPKSQVLTSSLTNVYVPYSKSLIFARLPVLRLSRITTLCPSLINDAQRLEPIKPAPPRHPYLFLQTHPPPSLLSFCQKW